MKFLIFSALITIYSHGLTKINTLDYEFSLNEKIPKEKIFKSLNSVTYNQKLLPSPSGLGGEFANFGKSISIHGNIAAIGAPNVDSHGVVYVYEYSGFNWIEKAVLKPSDGSSEDEFGSSVSLNDNLILVGAKRKSYDNKSFAGAGYLFEMENGSWQQTHRFTGSEVTENGLFGHKVILKDEKAYISSIGLNNGKVYCFEYINGQWTEIQVIASPGDTIADFGYSMSIHQNRMIIGSPDERINGALSGSAYIYENEKELWIFKQQIIASDASQGQDFGLAVDIQGDIAIVGDPNKDDPVRNIGSVYLFEFNGKTWIEKQTLAASKTKRNLYFGSQVKLDNEHVFVSAYGRVEASKEAGALFIFQRQSELWNQTELILPDDPQRDDFFGYTISSHENNLFIGSLYDDDHGNNSGSVTILKNIDNSWIQIQKLSMSDEIGAMGDQFSYSISTDGLNLAIGSPGDDEYGINSGSVYIYNRINNKWLLSEIIYPQDNLDYQYFGSSVDIKSNQLIIGSPQGTFASQNGNGKAYYYEYENDQWNLKQELSSDNIGSNGLFGYAVKIFSNTIIIGAPFNDVGSVYVFNENNNTWNLTQKLMSNQNDHQDMFGVSLDMDATKIVVGAINQLFINSSDYITGATHIFELNEGDWDRSQIIYPSGLNSRVDFGVSVKLSGETLVVGAKNDRVSGSITGSVYLYQNNSDIWEFSQRITPQITNRLHNFGNSIALNHQYLVVGADNFSFTNLFSEKFGAVFVYYFDENWKLLRSFNSNDSEYLDKFGFSLDLFDDQIIIGAQVDNTESGTDSGSAYTFILSDFIFSNSFENPDP